MFDLSFEKLLVLAVIALIIFGPNELPKMMAKAGQAIRELRRIAEGAKADLREGLGPEFASFDIDDLNPRRFVQKHLLDEFDLNGDTVAGAGTAAARAAVTDAGGGGMVANVLPPGQQPPYDPDAT